MCTVQALVSDAYAQCRHQFLKLMLSADSSSLHACSVHASVPYTHAEGIQNDRLKCTEGTDVYTPGARQFLACMLSVRIKDRYA